MPAGVDDGENAARRRPGVAGAARPDRGAATPGVLDKRALRAELLAARRARSGAEIEAARAAVRAHVLARCDGARPRWRRVAGYEPLRTEPGSVELLDELVDRGVEVIVPVVRPDRDLDWVGWRAPDRSLGVTAIAAVDAVLAPALAVDARGMRLGRGGGSYDRALTRVRPGVPVAALLYDDELLDAVPAEAWDVAVTAVVTPSGWRGVDAAVAP